MIDKKIRLLIVEPISDLGGVSQYILSIVRYLPREKFEIQVVASGNGPLFDLLKEENISVHTLKVDYSLFSFLPAVFSFRRFLKREEFDLIHAHTAKAGFLCCVSNKKLRARVIYTGHGFRFSQKVFLPVKALFFCFELFISNSSSFVTMLTRTEYDFGMSRGVLNNTKTRVVSTSIDVNRFVTITQEDVCGLRKQYGIPQDAFVVGMIGRLSFQKNPETFVRAAEILNTQIGNSYFLWVGDGDFREKTIRLANRLGVSDKFIIAGQKGSVEIPQLLSVMDVLLFTSRFEGLPIALLEAMAARKLIVAANVGGIQEIIKESVTGWLFDAGDYRSAASIVKNIYDNKLRVEEVKKSAFNLVSNDYSPKEKMAREFQAVYEEVVS